MRATGDFSFPLVLSGVKTRYWRTLEKEIERLSLQSVVVHHGFLPYSRVQALYSAASAVVFPSAYEGFGIPVVESVAIGKKVITSDIEVFRELGVPDAFRVDFDDPAALLQALMDDQPTVLERPVQTWLETARQTLAVLRKTARQPRLLVHPEPIQATPLERTITARAA